MTTIRTFILRCLNFSDFRFWKHQYEHATCPHVERGKYTWDIYARDFGLDHATIRETVAKRFQNLRTYIHYKRELEGSTCEGMAYRNEYYKNLTWNKFFHVLSDHTDRHLPHYG